MRDYLILNKIIQVDESELLEEVPELNMFTMTSDKEDPDVMMYFTERNQREECYAISYLSWRHRKILDQMFFSTHNHRVMLYTLNDKPYTLVLSGGQECDRESFLELFMAGFYSYISRFETMLLHASAVVYRKESLVFVAPSGTVKTTQAKLWNTYRDALILNGDKVFLKQESDGIHAWGSPWKGSSPYACNASAPVKAIIVLEQGKENRIRKLTGIEAMSRFVPHVFFPQWDEKCELGVLKFLDVVMKETDIYLLSCLPEESAVDLVEQTIWPE